MCWSCHPIDDIEQTEVNQGVSLGEEEGMFKERHLRNYSAYRLGNMGGTGREDEEVLERGKENKGALSWMSSEALLHEKVTYCAA